MSEAAISESGISSEEFDQLRLELSVKAKNGMDFIVAACLVWLAITYIWSLVQYSAYNRCVLTFIVGGLMIPLALGISKLLKTTWTVKGNPLQPLGLWLNFAQLFYFPILIFALLRDPDSFAMVYVVITGAHFFPYAWYYNEKVFAVFAGLIVMGALMLQLFLPIEQVYFLPLFMTVALGVMAVFLYLSYKKKQPALFESAN